MEANQTQALVTTNHQGAALAWYDDEDRVALLADTLCHGASPAELELFLQVCRRTQLDPFARQIFAIKRWDSKARREVMTTQVSIDGFRLIAQRSGQYAGQLGPYWCGPDGEWKEVWLSGQPPAAAKTGILRHDFSEPVWGIARWDSYVQTDKSGNPTAMWRKMGDVMLAKCSEGNGLRKTFPAELSGLYTREEMQGAPRTRAEEGDRLSPAESDAFAAEVAAALPARLFSQDDIDKAVALAKRCKTHDAADALRGKLTERVAQARRDEAATVTDVEAEAEPDGVDAPTQDHPSFKPEPAQPRRLTEQKPKPQFWETVKRDAERTGLSHPEGEDGFLGAMKVTVWAELNDFKGEARQRAVEVAGSKDKVTACNKHGFEAHIKQSMQDVTISEALSRRNAWYKRIRAVFLGETLGIDTPEVTSLTKLLDQCYADATSKAAPSGNPELPRRIGRHDPPSEQRPTERRR